MLRAGEWREVNFYDDEHTERPARIKSIGYQLSSLYSPWVTWGQIAEEFAKSYQYPEKLMNFVNSWLAETWKDNVTKRSVEMVKGAQCKTLERGRLPEGALLLTAGVDVQEDRMYWTVRAWGEHLTSWGIDHGEAETWDDITRQLIERQFEDSDGNMCVIQLICVDSGDQTDEVYGYCSDHSEICVPVKGASQRLKAPFTRSRLDRPDRFDGIILYMVDTFYFKSFIHSRLTKKPGENGAWMVYNEIDDEYSEQIVSEQKVLEKNRRNGKIIEVYKPVTQHAANHYLDSEVYSACAAEILEVRYLHKDKEQQTAKPTKPAPVKEEKGTPKWVRASNNWLRR
jgi:phage terminase large subunit GpA-like protein